jgi:hypothetical protein
MIDYRKILKAYMDQLSESVRGCSLSGLSAIRNN